MQHMGATLATLTSAELVEVRALVDRALDAKRAEESAALVRRILQDDRMARQVTEHRMTSAAAVMWDGHPSMLVGSAGPHPQPFSWAATPLPSIPQPQPQVLTPKESEKEATKRPPLPPVAHPKAAQKAKEPVFVPSVPHVRACKNKGCPCFYVCREDVDGVLEEAPPATLDLRRLFVIGCDPRANYADERDALIRAMGRSCPSLSVNVQHRTRYATIAFQTHRTAALAQARLSRVPAPEGDERGYEFRYTVSFLDSAPRHSHEDDDDNE